MSPRTPGRPPLNLAPARRPLHAALLAKVATHPEGIPCLVRPGGVDWLSDSDDEQQQAAEHCSSCPALNACKAFLVGHPKEAGVWAGTTERQREARSEAWRTAAAARRAAS